MAMQMHARKASCTSSSDLCPRLHEVRKDPSSGNRPKCYQSSANSVILCVSFREKGPARGSGKALWAPTAGSRAESQPKSNLMHFSFKRWDLVATILIISPKTNWPNWQISCSLNVHLCFVWRIGGLGPSGPRLRHCLQGADYSLEPVWQATTTSSEGTKGCRIDFLEFESLSLGSQGD